MRWMLHKEMGLQDSQIVSTDSWKKFNGESSEYQSVSIEIPACTSETNKVESHSC